MSAILFPGPEGDQNHLSISLGLWALGVSGATGLRDSAEEVADPLSSEQDHLLIPRLPGLCLCHCGFSISVKLNSASLWILTICLLSYFEIMEQTPSLCHSNSTLDHILQHFKVFKMKVQASGDSVFPGKLHSLSQLRWLSFGVD